MVALVLGSSRSSPSPVLLPASSTLECCVSEFVAFPAEPPAKVFADRRRHALGCRTLLLSLHRVISVFDHLRRSAREVLDELGPAGAHIGDPVLDRQVLLVRPLRLAAQHLGREDILPMLLALLGGSPRNRFKVAIAQLDE
eukprot:1325850-Prymnesium_polylepis.1